LHPDSFPSVYVLELTKHKKRAVTPQDQVQEDYNMRSLFHSMLFTENMTCQN
jgi:hypothetical protein